MIPEAGYYQPEIIPWDGGHPLTEELLFMKKKVVPFLLNHPYSGPFRYPVNAKAEGIYPDYFKVCILCPVLCLHNQRSYPTEISFSLFTLLILDFNFALTFLLIIKLNIEPRQTGRGEQ